MLRFIKSSLLLCTTLFISDVYGSTTEELREESKTLQIPVSDLVLFPQSGLTYHPETKTFIGPFFDEANHAIARVSNYYLGKIEGKEGVKAKLSKEQQKLEELRAKFNQDQIKRYHDLREKIFKGEELTGQEIESYNDLYKQESELIYTKGKIEFYQIRIDKYKKHFDMYSDMYTFLPKIFYLEMLASKSESGSSFPLIQVPDSLENKEVAYGFSCPPPIHFPSFDIIQHLTSDDIGDFDSKKWLSSIRRFIGYLEHYHTKSKIYSNKKLFDAVKEDEIFSSLTQEGEQSEEVISQIQKLMKEKTIKRLIARSWSLELKKQPLVNLFKAFVEVLNKFQQELKVQAQDKL